MCVCVPYGFWFSLVKYFQIWYAINALFFPVSVYQRHQAIYLSPEILTFSLMQKKLGKLSLPLIFILILNIR